MFQETHVLRVQEYQNTMRHTLIERDDIIYRPETIKSIGSLTVEWFSKNYKGHAHAASVKDDTNVIKSFVFLLGIDFLACIKCESIEGGRKRS
jgi:hypothetical protein